MPVSLTKMAKMVNKALCMQEKNTQSEGLMWSMTDEKKFHDTVPFKNSEK
jgi:hypothetical protein